MRHYAPLRHVYASPIFFFSCRHAMRYAMPLSLQRHAASKDMAAFRQRLMLLLL